MSLSAASINPPGEPGPPTSNDVTEIPSQPAEPVDNSPALTPRKPGPQKSRGFAPQESRKHSKQREAWERDLETPESGTRMLRLPQRTRPGPPDQRPGRDRPQPKHQAPPTGPRPTPSPPTTPKRQRPKAPPPHITP
ncbi:hypothetical protein San01_40930 [Streptomyces angustmyceticus]|uniref:Uncharacterized protein n=1 Tax=Streptomyces angustmyceticus TaxID=285578 RepID=A0A5J4LJ89_9ACTN|nr:hypothetical protein San01_40930 [Streptomyces angustmyceticus]